MEARTFEQTFELLEHTGLNWSVMKEPLFTQDGRGTESFGLFRNDNGQWLGTVGARYEVMQNATLAEMMIEASAGVDLEITRGDTWREDAGSTCRRGYLMSISAKAGLNGLLPRSIATTGARRSRSGVPTR